MTTHLKIDFVSDVSCPWCVIGLRALDEALARVQGDISAEVRFQPFELNPAMGPGGQDITEHITEKYGITVAQANANRENIRARGAALGFTFSMGGAQTGGQGGGRSRIYNTFDAHRLLHWAGLEDLGKHRALKEALFSAYFTHGQSPASHDVLVQLATDVGLDAARAREILDTDTYALEVRELEQLYQNSGINSVPAVIINQQHLISGGQPTEVFEQALRQIAAGQE